MLRFLTAGESHGRALIGIIEGLPSNVNIDTDYINRDLYRRKNVFGRSERMKMEEDRVKILSGIRDGKTTGAPIAIMIENKDYRPELFSNSEKIYNPRPGHADLVGLLKYNLDDIRDVIERASARETAIRTAIGSIAKLFLNNFDIRVYSRVVNIGGIKDEDEFLIDEEYIKKVETSPVRCGNKEIEEKMMKLIIQASEEGDTLGGIFEVLVAGLPVGLGSYVHYDRRINSRIGAAILSIPGVKGVEFGKGFELSSIPGSSAVDEIGYSEEKGYFRRTNNMGGIEGGITNRENLVIRAVMKPIPTLRKSVQTVNVATKEKVLSRYERSDITGVPAASVIAESVVAWEIACEFLDKFSGDSFEDVENAYMNYIKRVSKY